LIVKTSEIYKLPKFTPFWHEMLKITSTLPQTPYIRQGLLAFGNWTFAPSALAISPLTRSGRYPSF